MLEGVGEIFSDYKEMLKKLKKKQYEERTARFKNDFGHYFDEMNAYIESSDNKEVAMQELCDAFCADVDKKYRKWGRISGRVKLDLSFHLLYFVFPTIIAYEKDYSLAFADKLREVWNEKFGEKIVSCADYNSLYSSFNEKMFGMF